MFTSEIIVNIMATYDYLYSYFFWLDILSTLSMVFDIVYVKNAILNGEGSFDYQHLSQILNIIRMCRLVRISKIYKQISATKKNDKKTRSKTDSRVGRKMSDQATKKLIMTTFLLLVCLPMFESTFY